MGPNTATLAGGWADRLVPLHNENTRGITGWCLAPIDIAFSKLAAGRDKDIRFIRTMLQHALVDRQELAAFISGQPEPLTTLLASRLTRCEHAESLLPASGAEGFQAGCHIIKGEAFPVYLLIGLVAFSGDEHDVAC